MADISQDVVTKAGLDPFSRAIGGMEGRRDKLVKRSDELNRQREAIFKEEEGLIEQRGKEIAPSREAYAERAKQAPKIGVTEERIPEYERPTMDPKQLQESFGMLMAAAMMTGIGSRAPFYTAMNAMSGALQGFQAKDAQLVKEHNTEFGLAVRAIKERNDQKRREMEDAWKTYQHDLAGFKTQMELIAAKYDDPMALMAARAKSITEAQKIIDNNVKAVDTTVERLLRDKSNADTAAARLADSQARRQEAQTRYEQTRKDREEAAAKRLKEQEERLTSRRFRDTQSLRKEYLNDTKDVRKDLEQVDRILAYANAPGGFSDIQLRQAITQFQKGARGTNAMINSMVSFGSLDERIAGRVTRFFEGEYDPQQRGEIKDLFKAIKEHVLQPGLANEQAKYRWVATQNKLSPEESTLNPTAAELGGEGGEPEQLGGPGAGPAARPGFRVTPR